MSESMPEETSGPGLPPSPVPETTPPPRSRQRSVLSRLWRWSLLLVLVLGLILAVLAAGLTYLFPAGKVRPLAEAKLSAILNTPVRIGGLGFNLLTGLNLNDVTVGGPDPWLRVAAVVLDYDLTQLLRGRVTINQVRVEAPRLALVSRQGVWNFQPLLDAILKAPAGPVPPAAPGEPTAPAEPGVGLPLPEGVPLPLAVELAALSVRDLQVTVRMDEALAAELSGLTLTAQGKVDAVGMQAGMRVRLQPAPGPEGRPNVVFKMSGESPMELRTRLATDLTVDAQGLDRALLKGSVTLEKTRLRMAQRLPSPDLHIEFTAGADLSRQAVDLQAMDLRIGNAGRVRLSGSLTQVLGNPAFHFQVAEGRFDLAEWTRLLQVFRPPVSLGGRFLVTDLDVRGNLMDQQPDTVRVTRGRFAWTGGTVAHRASGTTLQGVGLDLNLGAVRLQKGVPEKASAQWTLRVRQTQSGDIVLKNLRQKGAFAGAGPLLERINLDLSGKIDAVSLAAPRLGPVSLPVEFQGKVQANHRTGNVTEGVTRVTLGKIGKAVTRLSARGFGKKGFDIQQKAELDLAALIGLVPPEQRQALSLGPVAGTGMVDLTVSGRLNKEFSPAAGKGLIRLGLKNLTASLVQPAAIVEGGRAEMSLPFEYKADGGLLVSDLKITAQAGRLAALDRFAAGPARLDTTVSLSEWLPLTGQIPRLAPRISTTVEVDAVTGSEPAFRVDDLRVEAKSRADWDPQDALRNMTLTGQVSLTGWEGLDQFAGGKAETSFKMDVHDLSLERTQAVVRARVQRPRLADGSLSLPEVSVEVNTRQNLQTGTVEIKRARLEVPDFLKAGLKGRLEEWGRKFDIEAQVAGLDLQQVMDRIPRQFLEPVQGLALSGKAAAAVTVQGRIPEAADLKKWDFPLQVKASLDLQGFGAQWPDKGLAVQDMEFSTRMDLRDNGLGLTGQGRAARVTKTGFNLKGTLAPRWEFDYSLSNWDRLEIKKHLLEVPGGMFRQTVGGRVEGLRRFLTQKAAPTPGNLLQFLDVALNTRTEVDPSLIAPFVEGLEASGAVRSRLDVKLVAGRQADLAGEVGFEDLHLTHSSGVQVAAVTGRIPIEKTLLLDRARLKPPGAGKSLARKGFFPQLREFSRFKNNLRIKRMQFDSLAASNLGMDVYFRGNRFAVDRFLVDFLGGSIGGSLFLTQTAAGPRLQFSTEFAHLDLNRLLRKKAGPPGRESEMDGHLRSAFEIRQGGAGEKVTLDQIRADLDITHIGREALDRALLFLDPEESNPAVVATRAQLKLASPENLGVVVENGNLSTQVGLIVLGTRIQAPALRRVPITRLGPFRKVQEQLQKLQDFQTVLQALSANGVEFAEDGALTFF